jgi:YidC/Oxa1 family membrane protein insertase
LLDILYTAVSWALLRWHDLFNAIGINKDSGINWTLSIVALVMTARLLLFRFFVKQVHYQRHMQDMQPKMAQIKAKYKDDKQAQQREMMKLQQEEGFNPITGCLPMFLQIPVFISLFHVLRHLSNSVKIADRIASGQAVSTSDLAKLKLYTFTQSETISGAKANLFKAPLAASFHDSSAVIKALGGDVSATRWVILPLLLISAAATFATQLMVKSNATVVAEGTAATIQKAMLYLIPVGVLASGLLFNFPLGVLLYWFTSNLWTLGQQAYIIRFHPHEPKAGADAAVGEVGRALAPKPGAKPDYNRARQGGQSGSHLANDAADKAADDVAGPAVTRAPRPGARPARPGNNRPPGKRPSQSKKRR